MRLSHYSSRYLFARSSCACAGLLLSALGHVGIVDRSGLHPLGRSSSGGRTAVSMPVLDILGLLFDDRYAHSIFRGWSPNLIPSRFLFVLLFGSVVCKIETRVCGGCALCGELVVLVCCIT